MLEQSIFYLGLIREGEGVAARVLNNLGVSLNKARQQVLKLLEVMSRKQGEGRGSNQMRIHLRWIQLSRDLTVSAREGKLDPVIGRSKGN